jgi:hypothetical protein
MIDNIMPGLLNAFKSQKYMTSFEAEIAQADLKFQCIAWRELIQVNISKSGQLLFTVLVNRAIICLIDEIYKGNIQPFKSVDEAIRCAGIELAQPFRGRFNFRARYYFLMMSWGANFLWSLPFVKSKQWTIAGKVTNLKIGKMRNEVIKIIRANL